MTRSNDAHQPLLSSTVVPLPYRSLDPFDDLRRCLKDHALSELLPTFVANNVTYVKLFALSDADFVAFGLTADQRERLTVVLNKMRSFMMNPPGQVIMSTSAPSPVVGTVVAAEYSPYANKGNVTYIIQQQDDIDRIEKQQDEQMSVIIFCIGKCLFSFLFINNFISFIKINYIYC